MLVEGDWGALDDVSHLTNAEIEGCWRALCACMLLKTTYSLCGRGTSRSEYLELRQASRHWLAQETSGVITFREACETLGWDYSRIKNRLLCRAEKLRLPAMNEVDQPEEPDEFGRENPTAAGMDAGPQPCDFDYVGE